MKLSSWCRHATRGVRVAVLATLWLVAACGVGLYIVCGLRNEIALLELWPPRIRFASNQRPFELCSVAASLMKDIEARYPPKASGLARILPWNWGVEPVVPLAAEPVLKGLRGLSENRLHLSDLRPDVIEHQLRILVIAPAAVNQFLDTLREVQQALRRPSH